MSHSSRRNALFSVLIAAACLGLTSSCATVQGAFVAPEIESPALGAPKALDLGASLAPEREVTLFADASSRPPAYAQRFADTQFIGHVPVGKVGYSAALPYSVSGGLFGANTLIDGIWLGGKFQLVGDRGAVATSPYQFAVFARAGYSTSSQNGDQDGWLGATGFPWESERKATFAYFGVTTGYRVSERFLVFAGGGTGAASTRAEVHQSISADQTSLGGTYRNAFDGTTASIGLGGEFGGDEARGAVGFQRTRYECEGLKYYDTSLLAHIEFRVTTLQ